MNSTENVYIPIQLTIALSLFKEPNDLEMQMNLNDSPESAFEVLRSEVEFDKMLNIARALS